MDRKKLSLALTLCVTLALYLVVIFLVKKGGFEAQFWVSLGFVMLAYLFLFFGLFFVSAKSRAGQVVGLPVDSLVWLYFFAQLFLGTIFLFFSWAFVAYFLPQFVVAMLFMLVFIPAVLSPSNYKDEKPEEKKEEKKEEENKQ